MHYYERMHHLVGGSKTAVPSLPNLEEPMGGAVPVYLIRTLVMVRLHVVARHAERVRLDPTVTHGGTAVHSTIRTREG